MIIQLDIQSDTAAMLTAQAQMQGLSVDTYLRRLVTGHDAAPVLSSPLSPAEKAGLWCQWAASHSRHSPLLSAEAISRESIYGERG